MSTPAPLTPDEMAAAIEEEFNWLKENPAFEERPASIEDFLDVGYLDIKSGIRPGLLKALIEIFGEKVNGHSIASVQRAIFTGAVGVGKTTMASIAIPYMLHWVLCLKDPQKFFGLLPGSRIAFMQMSTSEAQAKQVLFGDIKARTDNSKWFLENYNPDPKYTIKMKFPKDLWVLPGDSSETTFEGYNILGGIVDEIDSHKVTADKDYADVGWDTIESRVSSRFEDRGLIIAIGQMKKANGFAARKYKEMLDDSHAHVSRMTIWESRGWDYYKDASGKVPSFFYDTHRKNIIPDSVVPLISNKSIIEIPLVYQNSFANNPEKALRDLAGIPPMTGAPFISMVHRIEEARDRWQERNGHIGSPVTESCVQPQFEDWFICPDSLKRVMHIDLAYSAKSGNCLGIAMGHVREMMDVHGEIKPYIIFDFLLRMKAPPGGEIMLADARNLVYDLRDNRNFKINKVTFDGFQSTDSVQQLRKRRINADYLSVDKQKLPYEDLREAIYEERVEFPPYITQISTGSSKTFEVAVAELSELTDAGKKIDHPPDGSKDVADAMAAVTCTLMGNRSYHRGRINYSSGSGNVQSQMSDNDKITISVAGTRAPSTDYNISGLIVPPRLQPGRGRR